MAVILIPLILLLIILFESFGLHIIWDYALVELFKCNPIDWVSCFIIIFGVNILCIQSTISKAVNYYVDTQ